MFTAFAQPIPETELPEQPVVVEAPSPHLTTVKRLIWLYFWLLIFEGALRKWLLPGLSNPLLLVRDPVVILIYVTAGMAGVFPKNGFIVWTLALGFASFIVSEIAGSGNLLVSLFGLRTNFLHLPLIFLLPNVFNKQDMEKMAKWFLISSIPMALLVLAQFRAPADAWLNNGAGGSQNGQLESALGKIRPPGTFSFTMGLICYLSVAAAFAIHMLMEKNARNRKLANLAVLCIAIMVGISGSRSALGAMSLIFIAVAVICVKQPVFFGRSMKLIAGLVLAYLVLASWSEFREGIEVHQSRIEGGGGLKDGIFMRFFGDLLPLAALSDAHFFGAGLGMGTNAAASFVFGKTAFSLGENDWDRIIRESGPALGLAFIGLRISILFHLASRAFDALRRNEPLPLLLLAAAFPQVLNGQFGVPTMLGWAVFSGGLCLASTHASETVVVPLPAIEGKSPAPIELTSRGRSVYADQLHGEIEDPYIARFGP